MSEANILVSRVVKLFSEILFIILLPHALEATPDKIEVDKIVFDNIVLDKIIPAMIGLVKIVFDKIVLDKIVVVKRVPARIVLVKIVIVKIALDKIVLSFLWPHISPDVSPGREISDKGGIGFNILGDHTILS